MSKERAVARRKAQERSNLIFGSVIAGCVAAGVGFGVYKMMFDARGWLARHQRPKAPWERDPNA